MNRTCDNKMARILKNSSIKTKITSIILITSGFCIVLTLSTLLYINQHDEQESTINNISVLAKLIGNRSSAALTFNDKQLAQDNLESLRNHHSIILACLYDQSNQSFIKYQILAKTDHLCPDNYPPLHTSAHHRVKDNHLQIFEPIIVDQEYQGSLLIHASLQRVQQHLVRYLIISILIGIAIASIALFFASRLQTIISRPLIELTKIAKKVAENKDYSVRAEKFGEDEIGILVDSFNSMLSTIDNQNKTLITTTEKANAANAIKSQFLANMSHELRTPINGVLGMNELLLGSALNQEQQEYALLANQSGHVLLDTVNQILDLASIESVGLKLQPETVIMQDFLDNISQLFSSQLAIQKLELVIYIVNEIPSELIFDPVRVRQVFINLITNAIKFTNQGGVSVTVSWHKNRLFASVEDTGIGIPVEAQERIFESFQQVDNSSTRPFGGTGLGLAISQQICIAMNGNIKIERSTGAGSIFSVEMEVHSSSNTTINNNCLSYSGKIVLLCQSAPLKKWFKTVFEATNTSYQIVDNVAAVIKRIEELDVLIINSQFSTLELEKLLIHKRNTQRFIWLSWVGEKLPEKLTELLEVLFKPVTLTNLAAQLINTKKNTNVQLKPLKSFRLLLVDDNTINRKAMMSQLIKAGHNVDMAENGLEALKACQQKQYDLILMDIQMPQMDGLEATRKIRQQKQTYQPVIIGISAHVMQEHIESAQHAGMDDYLCKPIKERELLAKINQYLS